MRSVRRAFAALAVAVAATACGTGNGGSGDGDKVTLTFVTIPTPALTQAIAAYRKFAPNVRIDVSFQPLDAYQASLRTRIGGGNPPDMFGVWPGNGNSMAVAQVAPLGALADLSDQPWASRMPASLRPLLGIDGKIMLWSPGTTVIGAIYNKAVFRSAGVEVPTTWTELLAVCDRLKAAGVIPIAVGNQTPWVTQLIDYAIAPSTAFARNPDLAQDMLAGKASFASSGWRETLVRYVELERRGCYQPDPNGTTLERQQALVARGKAAMAVQVAPVMTDIRAANPEGEFGMFPFPANDRPQDLRIAAGLAVGFGVSARSRHPEEAKRFIAFLARPEVMRYFSSTGFTLPLDGSGAGAAPFLEPFLQLVAEGRTVPFMDQQWPNADTQQAHFAVAQELLAHRLSIDGALERLDRAYRQR